MDSKSKVESYAIQIASVLHKTYSGSIPLDKICEMVKEIVVEEELIDLVIDEARQILINEYEFEVVTENIKLGIEI